MKYERITAEVATIRATSRLGQIMGFIGFMAVIGVGAVWEVFDAL